MDVIHDHTLAGPLGTAPAAGGPDGDHLPRGGGVGGRVQAAYRVLGRPSFDLVAISEAPAAHRPRPQLGGGGPQRGRRPAFPFRERQGGTGRCGWAASTRTRAAHLAIDAARGRGTAPVLLAGKLAEEIEYDYFDEYGQRPRLGPDAEVRRRGRHRAASTSCWRRPGA